MNVSNQESMHMHAQSKRQRHVTSFLSMRRCKFSHHDINQHQHTHAGTQGTYLLWLQMLRPFRSTVRFSAQKSSIGGTKNSADVSDGGGSVVPFARSATSYMLPRWVCCAMYAASSGTRSGAFWTCKTGRKHLSRHAVGLQVISSNV